MEAIAKPEALHVVLGAGQIGTRLVELLLARGHRVRVVQRSAGARPRPRLEVVRGDLMDLDFAARAGAGASVVYDCMNPPYHQWAERLLPMGRGALHAARGARLVALDCLYMYGRASTPMREDSPRTPCSRKGALRVELEALRLAAHARGDVRVAIGRASDFFGADLPYSGFSARFFERIYAGKPGECMGDPDQPHAYTYADDVARALVTLGEREEAAPLTGTGQVWHLPTNPAESTRQLATRLGTALGLDVQMVRVPRLMLRALGVFVPFLREAVEMVYQWEMPFLVDDSRFVRTFGQVATPIDVQVGETAAWARARFGGARQVA